MTERRTMEEAMEAIERVERLCTAAKSGHEYEASYVEQWDDLRLLVSLAKRAVREPSGEAGWLIEATTPTPKGDR